MAHRRYRRHLRGIVDVDMGSSKGNVLLGAGLNIAGSLVAVRIAPLANILSKIPIIGDSPGLGIAVAAAAYNFFAKKKKGVAIDILTGAALVSAFPLLNRITQGTMGLVTTDFSAFSAIVPTVRMSDGTSRALSDGELGGPSVAVHQGLGFARADVLQGGILQ